MIIRSEDIRTACVNLNSAVDSSGNNSFSDTADKLEIKSVGNFLELYVVNNEYSVKVKIPLKETVDFKVTVDANVFLKLIPQLTTETIELIVSGTTLVIKGNGEYKIPIIYEDDTMVSLKTIEVENTISSFSVQSSVLKSILTYNSKEANKGIYALPSQRMFYVDKDGCITFTTGACVNKFTLPIEDVKMLFSMKFVRLFKLISSDTVNVTIGTNNVDGFESTVISIVNPELEIVGVVNTDDTLLSSVPVEVIRQRASKDYPYEVSIRQDVLLQTINRMLIFVDKNSINISCCKFLFHEDSVTIFDMNMNNKETIPYIASLENMDEEYQLNLDVMDIKLVVESVKQDTITIRFGDNQAAVFKNVNIDNIVPEVVL